MRGSLALGFEPVVFATLEVRAVKVRRPSRVVRVKGAARGESSRVLHCDGHVTGPPRGKGRPDSEHRKACVAGRASRSTTTVDDSRRDFLKLLAAVQPILLVATSLNTINRMPQGATQIESTAYPDRC